MIIKEQMILMNTVNELNLLVNSSINLKSFKKILYFYLLIIFYMTNNKSIFSISKKLSIFIPYKNIFYKSLNVSNISIKNKNIYGFCSMIQYFDEEILLYKDPKKYLYELKFINKKLINNLLFLCSCLNNLKTFNKIFNNNSAIYLLLLVSNIYCFIIDKISFLKELKKTDKILFYDLEIYKKFTFKKIINYCQRNSYKAQFFLFTYICENSSSYFLKKSSYLEQINDLFSIKYFSGLKISVVKNIVTFNDDIDNKIVKTEYFC